MKAPERFETDRLILRKPDIADAAAIFSRYSSDAEVAKYLGWARHESIDQARDFLSYSDAEWDRWSAGPYLIEPRSGGALLGGTGLAFESRTVASTGYVLARDAWGKGYATEALTAIVAIAQSLHVERLYALCHPEHPTSIRVLEKCGFRLEERLTGCVRFPNLGTGRLEDCLRFALASGSAAE